ncbi:MAG: NUDIX domain-containing protein [Polyangiaceae bacterium]
MGLVSAGLVVYRSAPEGLEVFLAHPGGPYFARKDEGSWTIPKGAPLEGEALRDAARREFEEEIGFAPEGELQELGHVRQRAGKLVHAWALAATLPPNFVLKSNDFELEWPPGSGLRKRFPEVDSQPPSSRSRWRTPRSSPHNAHSSNASLRWSHRTVEVIDKWPSRPPNHHAQRAAQATRAHRS